MSASIWSPNASTVGAVPIYPRTVGEELGGVTPTNTDYPEGHAYRYGAVGDGVTDDTSAIQTMFSFHTNFNGGGQLVFPRGNYRTTSSILIPPGWAHNTVDLQGGRITYDGAVDPAAAIFKFVKNQCYFNTFKNGYLDAGSKAGYCIYAAGEGWQYAIKANKLDNIELRYPTIACLQIGDQATSGQDMDGADWLCLKTYFRAVTPALSGAIMDGDNVFNTNFTHCFFNTDSGSTSAGHIRVIRAGSTFVYDAFFGNIDSAAYCIDHRSGILGVFGANSEEGSILKTSNMVEERKSIVLSCIMVNESTISTTPEYAVYAPVGQLIVQSCTFGKADSRMRNVYIGDSANISQTYLGSNASGTIFGKYELDFPDRCTIEGQNLSNVAVLNANPSFHLWEGTASNDLPFGFANTGSGTATIIRSSLNSVQGPYTALITVAAGYNTSNVIDGIQCKIPIAQTTKTGARSYTAVVRGKVTALSVATLTLRFNYYTAAGAFIGSNVASITPDGSGNFEGMTSIVVSDVTAAYAVTMVGIGTAAATGNIFLDNLYVVQTEAFIVNNGYHYKSYVDAWTKYVKPMQGLLEYSKAGRLVGGAVDSFNQIFWGTAAPTTGNYRRGDLVTNITAATGQPQGWICTVAGTPGTWRPLANIT